MNAVSASSRARSSTTFLLPFGSGPAGDDSEADGSSTVGPSLSDGEDGGSVQLVHATDSAAPPVRAGGDGRLEGRASSGEGLDDEPVRIPFPSLWTRGSTTAEPPAGDVSPEPSPQSDSRPLLIGEARRPHEATDAKDGQAPEADRVREQVRAAKLQMLARPETAHHAQVNVNDADVHSLVR